VEWAHGAFDARRCDGSRGCSRCGAAARSIATADFAWLVHYHVAFLGNEGFPKGFEDFAKLARRVCANGLLRRILTPVDNGVEKRRQRETRST